MRSAHSSRSTFGLVLLPLLAVVCLTGCPGGDNGPQAAFSGFPISGTAPLKVTFTDSSGGAGESITGWVWNFGDGATGSGQYASHTYVNPGTYTVSLTVTTSAGSDTETKTGYITVDPPTPPTASFSASPISGTLPLNVAFTDQSTPGSAAITGWSWSFGDSATSTSHNPAHTYTTVGTYTVSLTVTTSVGADTETKVDFISVDKGMPLVSVWPTATCITYGQPLASSTLSGGTASVSGWFAFDEPETMPEHGDYPAPVTFMPSDTANYNTVSGTVDIHVGRGDVWYVKIGTSGDGYSWATAFGTIQEGVDAAFADCGGEVWVAAGTYTADVPPDG
ncbi:MAG TPA: PKD domain-containing protein, partial [Candidatus Bathyarchaeia archaeon]|nr:PKD domain-containing protein [Candidatus Bathyarchaeia archaeon]